MTIRPAIRDPKAFVSGAIFIALGLVFGIGALALQMGTAARMGPGYFPFLMAVMLGILGVVAIAEGLLRTGERPTGANLRAIVLISGAVLVFALSIRPLGLVPTVALASFLFSMADRDLRILPSAVAGIVLGVAAWAIFILALGLPWRAFPLP